MLKVFLFAEALAAAEAVAAPGMEDIMQIALQLLFLAVGFVMLIKGADWFVDGASKIADRFGIPQLVIGLTIVAMGTSAPEAAVSITSALKGSAGITIGNVVGSNIMNVLVILGLTAVIRAIAVKKSTIRYEIPFTIGITVILAVLGLADNTVSRLDGVILWALMIVYLAYLLWMAKKGQDVIEDVPEATKKDTLPRMILSILVGGALIVWGADVTVDAATELATIFGMSDRLIGLTIVAFGTSLPELVTSVTAAIKGKADIAVGNIVGSNIFNILFVLAASAAILPMNINAQCLTDLLILMAASLGTYGFCVTKKRVSRAEGIILTVVYVVYLAYAIIR